MGDKIEETIESIKKKDRQSNKVKREKYFDRIFLDLYIKEDRDTSKEKKRRRKKRSRGVT